MSNIITTQAAKLGERFGMEGDGRELVQVLKSTAFKGEVTDAQMAALMVVANQYGLNPFTRELFAFPDKQNGIVPVVGVDGWSRIINSHPQFDGIEFHYADEFVTMPGAKLAPEWIECHIHRKDRSRPVVVREYLDEVYRAPFKGKYGDVTGPWQTHTKRFLRHKAMIQCARLAFGYGGIYDQDEAERIVEAAPVKHMGTVEDATPQPAYTPEQFADLLPSWRKAIAAGKATADGVMGKIKTKGTVTAEQEAAIRAPIEQPAPPPTQQAEPVTDVQHKGEAAPVALTAQDLEKRLRDAKDLDTLYAVADLIGEVPDPEHRAALTAVFEERQFALESA